MTDRDAGAELEAASEAIRAAVLRLLQEGETHPQLVVMATAIVAGELAAGAALATGDDVEAVLGELAEVLRQVGREQGERLRHETLPVAGNA